MRANNDKGNKHKFIVHMDERDLVEIIEVAYDLLTIKYEVDDHVAPSLIPSILRAASASLRKAIAEYPEPYDR